jgi:hypothetical protein
MTQICKERETLACSRMRGFRIDVPPMAEVAGGRPQGAELERQPPAGSFLGPSRQSGYCVVMCSGRIATAMRPGASGGGPGCSMP